MESEDRVRVSARIPGTTQLRGIISSRLTSTISITVYAPHAQSLDFDEILINLTPLQSSTETLYAITGALLYDGDTVYSTGESDDGLMGALNFTVIPPEVAEITGNVLNILRYTPEATLEVELSTPLALQQVTCLLPIQRMIRQSEV